MVYNYFLNGLYIASEIELPELTVAAGKTQITIRKGIVDNIPDNNIINNRRYRINGSDFILDIADVATFQLKNSNEVVVQPYAEATESSIRVFLFATILGTLLIQNDMFSLHASSVKAGDAAVLICGDSGAGKSTVALGLHEKGHEVFNDDISTICFDANASPRVYTGVRYLKLKEQSLEAFGYEKTGFRELKISGKYNFPLTHSAGIEPVPVKAIFFVEKTTGGPISQEQLNGLKVFENICRHTFRYHLVKRFNKTAIHFEHCKQLTSKVPFIRISRPEDARPQDLVNYIHDIIRSL